MSSVTFVAIDADRRDYQTLMGPTVTGIPWNAAEKFILDAKPDGLFYWTLEGTSHYGRFITIERPNRMQHTWVSPDTLGEESTRRPMGVATGDNVAAIAKARTKCVSLFSMKALILSFR